MPKAAFPAILWGMKTMSYNNALTIYQNSIVLHTDLNVFVKDRGSVWMKESGRSTKWRWTYGSPDADGYPRVKIDGKNRRVHILVAEAFIPNPDNKTTVDHKNRVRNDNRVENLRWATPKEQIENSKTVIDRADYGVREIEDPLLYRRNYNKVYYEKNKHAIMAQHTEYRYRKKGQPHG